MSKSLSPINENIFSSIVHNKNVENEESHNNYEY